jgi:hypothetical protein
MANAGAQCFALHFNPKLSATTGSRSASHDHPRSIHSIREWYAHSSRPGGNGPAAAVSRVLHVDLAHGIELGEQVVRQA